MPGSLHDTSPHLACPPPTCPHVQTKTPRLRGLPVRGRARKGPGLGWPRREALRAPAANESVGRPRPELGHLGLDWRILTLLRREGGGPHAHPSTVRLRLGHSPERQRKEAHRPAETLHSPPRQDPARPRGTLRLPLPPTFQGLLLRSPGHVGPSLLPWDAQAESWERGAFSGPRETQGRLRKPQMQT